jgi:hypothetical protein
MAKEIKLKEKSLGIFLRDFINVRCLMSVSSYLYMKATFVAMAEKLGSILVV